MHRQTLHSLKCAIADARRAARRDFTALVIVGSAPYIGCTDPGSTRRGTAERCFMLPSDEGAKPCPILRIHHFAASTACRHSPSAGQIPWRSRSRPIPAWTTGNRPGTWPVILRRTWRQLATALRRTAPAAALANITIHTSTVHGCCGNGVPDFCLPGTKRVAYSTGGQSHACHYP